MPDVKAWVPMRIYVYHASDIHKQSRWDLTNAKIFTEDSSLFFVVWNTNTSADEVNIDLVKINKRTYQCKMHFNPDPIKKVQEVIFTRIISKEYHPSLIVKL